MIRNALSPRRTGLLVLLALLVGGAVAAAQAAGGGAPAPAPVARATTLAAPAPTRPARPPVAVLTPGAPPVLPAGLPCHGARKAARTAPSERLLDALGILRRDRNDDDALPAQALRALKARGLEPVDARSARLLRADGAARAWVVPVPDVGPVNPFDCRRGARPREGIAVVAVGGAPAGGGGALRDLQRGLAAPAVDSCAGPARDMLGVSGVVPDGVDAVFITAADGTATRADVRDNGYAFVLPRPRRPEPRYLVWTGTDGTPHVQPLGFVASGLRGACRARRLPPVVAPNPLAAGCGPLVVAPRPAFVAPSQPPVPRRAPRAIPAPAPLLLSPPCILPPEVLPRPARALPAPGAPPRPAPAPPRGP